MDDEKSREKRLQQLGRELSSMSISERDKYLAVCRQEIKYADGYSAEYYQNYLEAAKYV